MTKYELIDAILKILYEPSTNDQKRILKLKQFVEKIIMENK